MKKTGRLVHYDVKIRWVYGNNIHKLQGMSSLIIALDENIKGKYVHEEMLEQAENYVLENLPKWTKGDKTRFIAFTRDMLEVQTQEIKLV